MPNSDATKDKVYFVPEGSPVHPDLYDTRVRLMMIKSGKLRPEDLKKKFSTLPDDSSHADFRDYRTVVNDNDTSSGSENGFRH